MGIFDIFRKKTDNRHNYDFQPEDRDFSLEIRRQKAELRKLEFEKQKLEMQFELNQLREEIAELQQPETTESDDMSATDKMLLMLATKFLSNTSINSKENAPPNVIPETNSTSVDRGIILSDEGIDAIIAQMPKLQRKMLKAMPESDVLQLAKKQFPDYSDTTIAKAVSRLRI